MTARFRTARQWNWAQIRKRAAADRIGRVYVDLPTSRERVRVGPELESGVCRVVVPVVPVGVDRQGQAGARRAGGLRRSVCGFLAMPNRGLPKTSGIQPRPLLSAEATASGLTEGLRAR